MTDTTTFAREVLTTGTQALPAAGTRATVSPAPGTWYADDGRVPEAPTIIEDVQAGLRGRRAATELVVAQPTFAGNLHGELPGTPYVVRWMNGQGVHEVPTGYVGRERLGPLVLGWRLRATGPVSRVQRRAHARVEITLPVQLVVLDDGEPGREPGVRLLDGVCVNLSEGGILAVIETPLPALRTAVEVRFGLGSQSFALPGSVVRHQAAPVAVALAFDTPDAHGDRLRPLLFAHQLQTRRLGVA
jgi:hypothetical protein